MLDLQYITHLSKAFCSFNVTQSDVTWRNRPNFLDVSESVLLRGHI